MSDGKLRWLFFGHSWKCVTIYEYIFLKHCKLGKGFALVFFFPRLICQFWSVSNRTVWMLDQKCRSGPLRLYAAYANSLFSQSLRTEAWDVKKTFLRNYSVIYIPTHGCKITDALQAAKWLWESHTTEVGRAFRLAYWFLIFDNDRDREYMDGLFEWTDMSEI